MRVALLISGYLRNYRSSIKFINNEIINKFDTVDIFLHITKNENSEDKYFNLIDEESDIKNIGDTLKPTTLLIEKNSIYSTDKKINDTFNQWNKLYKLNELKNINEKLTHKRYDLVIRYRPDLDVTSKSIFMNNFGINDILYIPRDSKIDKSKLTTENDDYVSDAIAFGNSDVMDKYFNIYKYLPELICQFGPVSETLLFKYLKLSKINYSLIDVEYSFILSKCNVFAICGDSGSGKSTLGNILKNSFSDAFVLECDRYHKWERTDKNWQTLTPLNPDANYITKMKEDIFNLKIGNDIFHVDYDHTSGKFTQKESISPSNNLIVCGLHALYADANTSVYDLKIFIDTDEQLKKKWKIWRDTNERGYYNIKSVTENIEKREHDFYNYIYPQKENADLIIKFYSNTNIYNIDNRDKISLSISIAKKFNITKIISQLDNANIKYNIESNDKKFITMIFQTYKKIELQPHGKIYITDTFYDYILFFIFNLTLNH